MMMIILFTTMTLFVEVVITRIIILVATATGQRTKMMPICMGTKCTVVIVLMKTFFIVMTATVQQVEERATKRQAGT
jgi:hypothetical protein